METPTYQYQDVINLSQPLTVSRDTSDRELLKKLFGSEQEVKTSWVYKCSPPERLKVDGDNAPAYIPESPLVEVEREVTDSKGEVIKIKELDSEKIIAWLRYQGLVNVIEDSYSRACARSRQRDKDHRSKNFLKFDDETFIEEEALANDKTTKEELLEMRTALIMCSAAGKKLDGTPMTNPQEDLKAACDMMAKLTARIEAKSRK